MPRKVRKNVPQYMAVESFSVNLDGNGKVTRDGSGAPKEFHKDRTRVYEDDPILDHMPEHYFVPLEDHDPNIA